MADTCDLVFELISPLRDQIREPLLIQRHEIVGTEGHESSIAPDVEKGRRIFNFAGRATRKTNTARWRSIVAQPVDVDFHGKLPCSAGWPLQQTNKFNEKDHLVRARRNNVIPEVSDRDRLASR